MLTLPAAAQMDLSLNQALAMAVQANPLLQAGEEKIAAAEGVRRQASFMPNPRLILQTENTRPYSPFVWPRDTDNFAYLQQTFETAGKRDKRTTAAAASVRRAELERDLVRRQIRNRVKIAYWQAVAAKLAETELAENVQNFRRIVEYHEVRVREGAMAEADLIRVRLEGERLEMALNSSTLDAERARIHLLREMGQTEFPAVRLTDTVDNEVARPAGTVESALESRAEMKLARQIVEQARGILAVQQAAARPNVDAVFGYKRTVGFDTMIGGVQVDLPFANRNQGGIQAATAEIRLAESSLAATQALIRAEVAAAERDFELRRKQAGGLLKSMLAKAGENARIAEAAYKEGGADLLRLLDAQRLRIETQLLYYRALAEYRQSAAVLETALGVAE